MMIGSGGETRALSLRCGMISFKEKDEETLYNKLVCCIFLVFYAVLTSRDS
jgi:hypothetical protein